MNEKKGGGKIIFNAKKMMNSEFPFKIYKTTGALKQLEHAHDYIQIWCVKQGECIHCFNGTPIY